MGAYKSIHEKIHHGGKIHHRDHRDHREKYFYSPEEGLEGYGALFVGPQSLLASLLCVLCGLCGETEIFWLMSL
jgi:hypothetical protein